MICVIAEFYFFRNCHFYFDLIRVVAYEKEKTMTIMIESMKMYSLILVIVSQIFFVVDLIVNSLYCDIMIMIYFSNFSKIKVFLMHIVMIFRSVLKNEVKVNVSSVKWKLCRNVLIIIDFFGCS